MKSISVSRTIAAPREAVWSLLCDTDRYSEWVANTCAVTRTDGDAEIGATYEERNVVIGPWRTTSRWTVIEFDPPRRQVHRGMGITFLSEARLVIELTEAAPGSTEITIAFEYETSMWPLGAVVDLVVGKKLRHNQAVTLDNLAAIAERELTPAAAHAAV